MKNKFVDRFVFPEFLQIDTHHLGHPNLGLPGDLADLRNGNPIRRLRNYDIGIGEEGLIVIYKEIINNSQRTLEPSLAFFVKITNRTNIQNPNFIYRYEFTGTGEIKANDLKYEPSITDENELWYYAILNHQVKLL